ncbi:MAG: sigma-54-dependent transcriptional regulator [Bdellovibrionia bacterium]
MSLVDFDVIKFKSFEMNRILATVQQVAASVAPILVSGPTGSGKSALAHFIHRQSRREKLLIVDCKKNEPLPALGKNSTLLIENIDYADGTFQENLFELMAINEDWKPRVLATSKRDLKSIVKVEQFRADLFYKLSVIHLEIPKLSSRIEDIPQLVEFMVEVSSIIHGKGQVDLSPLALQKLEQWSWNANVRELENVVERAVILCKNNVISEENITFEPVSDEVLIEFSPGMSLSEVEKRLILQTLELTSQNRTKAAGLLGISIRTLRNKLNEYRIEGEL